MRQAAQLPQLTSLRFFAAFWVLGFHTIPRTGPTGAWAAFWNVGWIGVTFFFVLSGFILTYTYGRDGGRLDRRRFWVARFARVYPLYLFAMLFAVPQLLRFLRLAAAQGRPLGASQITGVVISSVAMLQAWFGQLVCVWNCPSWSLSDEAFFYALFPLVLPLATGRRGRALLLAATVGGMAFIAWGALVSGAPAFAVQAAEAAVHPLARLPEFLLGCWLGGVFLARRPSWSASSAVAIATAAGIVVIAAWAGLHPALGLPHLVAAPLFALLIIAVASSRMPSRGFLAAAPLVLLGEASYSLYMLHGPLHGYVLAAFNRVAPSASVGARFVVYVVAALALAIASFRWLERPARRWIRERFAGHERAVAARAVRRAAPASAP
jgi:peptidoglycan/LPS O-acetylase OafA/YrhL